MAYLNVCIMMGNLTKNPELRYTQQGSPVCEFAIAVNKKSHDREEVCYIDVVAWGKSAENCSRYLGKGSPVIVEGYLRQESWEDRNGGGRRSRLKLVAENIQFISSPRSAENGGQEASQDYSEPSQPTSPQPPPQKEPTPRFYGDSGRSVPPAPEQPAPPPDIPAPSEQPDDDIPF